MKTIFSIILCSIIFASSMFAQSKDVTPNADAEILYVIIVQNDMDNKEKIKKLMDMKSSDVSVQERNNELLFLYKGLQFTSAVEPDFIKEIKIYKNEKATEAYPSAPAGGVIEMKVDNIEALIRIFHSIKAS